jgi:hypothetical protein
MMMEDNVKMQTQNEEKGKKNLIISLIILGIILALFIISYLNGASVVGKN